MRLCRTYGTAASHKPKPFEGTTGDTLSLIEFSYVYSLRHSVYVRIRWPSSVVDESVMNITREKSIDQLFGFTQFKL